MLEALLYALSAAVFASAVFTTFLAGAGFILALVGWLF